MFMPCPGCVFDIVQFCFADDGVWLNRIERIEDEQNNIIQRLSTLEHFVRPLVSPHFHPYYHHGIPPPSALLFGSVPNPPSLLPSLARCLIRLLFLPLVPYRTQPIPYNLARPQYNLHHLLNLQRVPQHPTEKTTNHYPRHQSTAETEICEECLVLFRNKQGQIAVCGGSNRKIPTESKAGSIACKLAREAIFGAVHSLWHAKTASNCLKPS